MTLDSHDSNSSIPSMLSLRPLANEPFTDSRPADEAGGLAPGEALRAGLNAMILSPGQERDALPEQDLEELQERSLDILYRLLAEAGFDLRERLVIALDAGGRLHVGEHPQAQAISLILNDHPYLADNLRLMAASALALRGAHDFALARGLLRGGLKDGPLLFQACLKGGLSHFHLLGRGH